MSKINGLDVVLELSSDNITWKTLICEISSGLNATRNSNQVETKCDSGAAYTTLGAVTGTIPFTALTETNPTASQVSANELFSYFNSKTYLYWRFRYPSGSGSQLTRKGNGYVVSLNETFAIGELVQVEGEISVDGAISLS